MSRMLRSMIWLPAALALALVAGTDDGAGSAVAQSKPAVTSLLDNKLRPERQSATDLEIGGELARWPEGSARYIAREDLLKLPQVTYTVTDDSNFTKPTQISGVLLKTLIDLFGASGTNLVVAICDDKYRANYPRDYLAAHQPVLVLTLNGEGPSEWHVGPKDATGYDMGPYMISHAKFTPSLKILAHSDEPQIPWGVVRLEFRKESVVFGAIAPPGVHANDADVQDGYRIAEQNCFRCHNSGAEGGQKSGVTWTVLAAMASGSPDFFTGYVRDPHATNRRTQMAPSPQYDDATMLALIAYFRTFSPPEKQ